MNKTTEADNPASLGEQFARLHQAGAPLILPNPWDVGSAIMLTSLGFKALATTSAGYAYSVGKVDGAVGRDAMMAHIAQVVGATRLPVSADLENGWADAPDAVAETITLAVGTGLAGGSIEDATGQPDQPIYDHGLATERIAAAAEAVRNLPEKFVLCARAENFLCGNPDLTDTIKRLQAYQEAGADVLYAPGLRTIDDVRSVINSVDRPVNVIASPRFSVAELASVGAARISLGSAMARTAYGAMIQAAADIQGDGAFTFIKNAPGFQQLNSLLGSENA
ncbi:MAG: isocitrate lyase/phosphoenolpyruvate mutase family protein [Burkholderiaceae bacterium]